MFEWLLNGTSALSIEYVDQWPHLGHVISVHCEDEYDIINRRNRMCDQINNVLYFFDKRDPFVKIRLLTSYCYSLYGSVLWDLSHPCIDSDVDRGGKVFVEHLISLLTHLVNYFPDYVVRYPS